jgi:acetyl esterase/lipase
VKKIKSILIVAFVLIAASCKKESKESVNAMTMTDVSYGTDATQKMDVYLPENRDANTPVVLFIHGGGFISGDKKEFSTQVRDLSAQGFAVVSINYRLVNVDGVFSTPIVHKPSSVKIADQLNDVESAVKFAVSKAAEWKMSTDKWGIAGHSAGGTLALLYAYGEKNADKRVKVVGNLAGVTTLGFIDESQFKLLDPKLVEVIFRAVGAEGKNANKAAYLAVSPYWLVSQGKGIPTINIRPEINNVDDLPDGSKAEYKLFTDVLNSKGVPNKWVEVAGADHSFSKPGNSATVISEMSVFFKARL